MFDTHKAHGTLEWASLVQPAIDLAESGFAVSKRLKNGAEVNKSDKTPQG